MPKITLMRILAENKWPLVNGIAASGASVVSVINKWSLSHLIQVATLILIVLQNIYVLWKIRKEYRLDRLSEKQPDIEYPTINGQSKKKSDGAFRRLISRIKKFFGEVS